MTETNTDIALRIDIGPPLVNSRWENFALALAAGETRSEAYRLAGYKQSKNAGTMAAKLYSNVLVRERVEHIRDAIADTRIMTMRDIQIHLSEIGGARLKDFHNKSGVLDPFADGVENQAALAQVEQEYDENGLEAFPNKIKLHNPVPALDMLIKLKGGYPPQRLEVTGKDGGAIKVEDTRVKLLGILAQVSVRLEEKEKKEG